MCGLKCLYEGNVGMEQSEFGVLCQNSWQVCAKWGLFSFGGRIHSIAEDGKRKARGRNKFKLHIWKKKNKN